MCFLFATFYKARLAEIRARLLAGPKRFRRFRTD